ncbi:efflux RND transporter permease subunit [Catenovulum sp. SX2]|uniref:efflux RND transporter permease subunit n=1 Tax=Catenovulum sp. SX2 TaxID=3398614 RepID=UPI003F837F4E
MKHQWLETMVKRPFWVIVLGCIVAFTLAAGAQNLYFRGDYKVFFGPENVQLQEFESMQRTFSKNDNVAIVVVPKSGDVFNKDIFTLVMQMTEDAWQTPFSTRVDSITNYQHTEAEGDDLIVDYLVGEFSDVEITPQMIDKAREVTLHEPLLVNRIVSPTGHVTMINVTVQLPDKLDQTADVMQVTASVRALVEKYSKLYPQVDFHLTGIIMMNNSFAEESILDLSTLVPGMFLAVLIMLAILLRSILATVATLIVIAFSILAAMGFFGWAGMYMSTATIGAPTIIMTLAVADSVHIIASVNYNLRQGMEKSQAIVEALKLNLAPVFITSLTTAVGFLTFNFSDVPPLRHLGNLVAFGVVMAFIFAITILPALLYVFPIKPANTGDGKLTMMDQFADWVVRKHKLILPATAVMVLAISAMVPLNNVNDVPVEYFGEDIKFRQASDFMDDNLQGVSTIDFAFHTNEESGINDPEFLAVIEKFSQWLREQSTVDHVLTLTDTFKRLNKNMNADDPAMYKLPEQQEIAAQFLLMYEMSLPYGLDLNNQLNVDKSSMRLSIAMDNLGSKEVIDMENSVRAWFADNAPQVKVTAASPSLMFAHIGETNMQSMLMGSALALVLISILLVFALKSVKFGLISLLPNLAPAAMGFGIWAVFVGQVNLGLSIVTSMCLGIVVDDTVHFLSKYKKAREKGQNAEQAVRYAFASVGRALWITTLVLFVGFMVLAQSSFALNGDMGLLTAIIMVLALVVDFLLLPAFLLVFDKKVYSSGVENVEQKQSESLA